MFTYGSVCSGIEAASIAWEGMGWSPAWFSEIDTFPCAVLAHHWPHTPNLGDMTKIADLVANDNVPAPDILVGGTPCQAFSVAGLRAGLSDDRGALTIHFVRLANEIDAARHVRGRHPAVIVWENVPGVLSSKDNAFGCFLAGLAGEDYPLHPPGGKWTDAGCVYGPQRAVAWRILDAQYFGLAQRRRRVFVVASARTGFDPAAVLFEREGVRRDTAPSRGTWQDIACTLDARTEGGGFQGTDGATGGHVVAPPAWPKVFGGNNTSGPIDVAPARNACASASASGRMDFESEAFIVHGTQDPCVSTDTAFALGRNNGGENAVFAIQAGALRTNPMSGPDGVGVQEGHAYTLEARAEVQAVAVALRGREGGATAELGDDLAGCLRASSGGGDKPHALFRSAVRRLTPRECERLQGFPDGHTLVPHRGKPAADGPRYKALGNSMAVPCMRWIGKRINLGLMSGE